MKMKVLSGLMVLVGMLFVLSACLPEKFGQERLDQLCRSYCAEATVIEETRFEPAPNASSLANHCGQIRGNTLIPAGTRVFVATVMPNGFYNNAALVGFLDENGTARVGWVDADFLGEWSPREMIGLVDHCSIP